MNHITKIPLTPKSMPPTNNKHVQLRALFTISTWLIRCADHDAGEGGGAWRPLPAAVHAIGGCSHGGSQAGVRGSGEGGVVSFIWSVP